MEVRKSVKPEDLCLHELFEEQVHCTPEAVAVVDPEISLTYAELDRRAELLAGHLRNAGVGPDELVGVYLERRAEYIVACLAALKAGGAYLILEPAYPPSLLADVVADAEPRIVLTQDHLTERLPEDVELFSLDRGWEEGLDKAPVEKADVTQENLAFVSYSSGTTGKPKGIANPHRAPVRSYLWRFGISDYEPGDRVGCNVFFIWEMWRPLLRGATTVVIPDDVIYDPTALISFLDDYDVTEILMTPSLLETVLNAGGPEVTQRLSTLKTLWLHGEVVTRTLARRTLDLLPDTRLLNGYSISEAHEVAAGDTGELIANDEATYCPVGQLMDPERTYILDETMKPAPDGEAGEIFVGTDCLARGYVNRPETTAERFIEDPFSEEDGALMYRSGDKGRILSDGTLEVMGRVDFMVKIRGYSVELGAVEAAIEEHLAVSNCVVVAEGEEGTDKRLVAYLVRDAEDGERYSDWSPDSKTGRSPEIRSLLRESLPHYAIPAVFVELDALPIQATTGKVDRGELPSPPPRLSRPSEDSERPVPKLPADASRSDKEALLSRFWEDVLLLEEGEVSRGDDFFDLGGHSLAAAQLSSRVEESFGVDVSMPLFMEDPTVAGLCDRIEALQSDGPSEASRLTADDLRAEVVLEREVVPEDLGARGVKALREAEDIFLTGATGFLGAFLLDELLSVTDARIHCLVRPREDEAPLETIRANLERYGLSSAESERIVTVPGDLGAPLLGMSEEDFDALVREVDTIFHAGAAVNLVYPYAALKDANVGGTREVLRLAGRHRVKPVHYVSTNGIFPNGMGVCEEDADLDALAGARDEGYGQSKWVAESLVWRASERGLPVSVYRPGTISGDSATGAANARDLIGALVVESIRIGAAPEIEGWRMEMSPVDFVAAAIVHIASDPYAEGGVYHLSHPEAPTAEEVFDWLEELGYPLDRLPYSEWQRAMKAAPPTEDDPVGGVLRGALPASDEIQDGNVHDDVNTRRALDGGPVRPEFNANLIATYARYFVEQGWVEAPDLQEARRG